MNGMTTGQKVRVAMYLDDFKESNGGCIICQREITDYFFTPTEENGHIELHVYGSCTGHAMLSNSDALLDKAVNNLLPKLQENDEKSVLMVILFNHDGEDLKYSTALEKV